MRNYLVEINNKNYKKINIKKIVKKCDKDNLKVIFKYNNLSDNNIKEFNDIQTAINIKDIIKRFGFYL